MGLFKVGDFIDLETVTGYPVAKLDHFEKNPDDAPFIVIAGYVWLYARRSEPSLTFAEVREWTDDQFAEKAEAMRAEAAAAANPTKGASSRGSRRSATSGGSRRKSSARSKSRSTKR